MRWLLALLVLANLFTFALFQGWLSPWVRGDREPQRVSAQRSPERLRVVPLDRLGPARSPQPSRALQPASAPPGPGVASEAASAAFAPDAGATPDAEVCVAFVMLDEQRAGRLREALQAAGAQVASTRIEQPSSYLVYAPPAFTRAEAQQRLAALRAAGQGDAFVMQDGPLRLAISVGLFRTEESARTLVTQLQERGETGLQIAPRGPVTVRTRLQARWPDAAAAAASAAIGSRFDAVPRDCD